MIAFLCIFQKKMLKILLEKFRKEGKSMKVKDCMCHQVCYCKPDTTISEAAKTMCENHIGCIPVCNDEKCVVGILTDRDIILRSVACDKDAHNTKVSDIMSCNAVCCDCNSEITEASKMMGEQQIRRIPVTENGKLVGILTLGDLAKNQQLDNNFVGQTAESICGCDKKNAE